MPCREHLSQLRQSTTELDRRNVQVAVVTFEALWRAQAYVEEHDLPWPLLIDEDRELFRAYGMDRGSVREVMGWNAWKKYFHLLRRGERLHRPTGDVYQLGGDVVIDSAGFVRMHHVGRGPADRPSVDALLAALGDTVVN